MEQEIEREMLIDAGEIEPDEYQDEYEPEVTVEPQKVTIDFKSLDEMVNALYMQLYMPLMSQKTRISIFARLISRRQMAIQNINMLCEITVVFSTTDFDDRETLLITRHICQSHD